MGTSLSNCQGVIHRPDAELNASELLRGCKLSAWRFNNLTAGQLPFERHTHAQVTSGIIDLRNGLGTYRRELQTRSPRFINNLNRKTRNLERDFGKVHSVVESRDSSALRSLIAWKSEQCRQKGWVDIFDRHWVRALIDYLFSVDSDLFSATVSMLYVAETPIAGSLNLRAGSFVAGWFNAYDPEFARYSPGLIQIVHMTEGLAAAGAQVIEMGGTAEYKNDFKSGDIHFTKGVITRGPLTTSVNQARTISGDWARKQVRRSAFVYRTADRLLRGLGRIT